jgi:hypothetical protein
MIDIVERKIRKVTKSESESRSSRFGNRNLEREMTTLHAMTSSSICTVEMSSARATRCPEVVLPRVSAEAVQKTNLLDNRSLAYGFDAR